MENKKNDFSEWYNEIIEISGLSDKRYPVKGMNVWMPYGLKAMQNIDRAIRTSVDSRDFQEVSFPVLITRDQLAVEFDHIKGFENEVFWVTKGGSEPLEVDMALRPTSESAMYGMFSLWVRSHADLPLRVYQIVNVYRYETKHTRSFIRIREIHFFEAHTAHDTYESSERQMQEYREIWSEISSDLCLPYQIHQRPEWDKFPGARYTLAFDTILPGGRSLQIGTIHQYGTNFAETYDIKYLQDNGEHEFANQTTFGLSERLLAAVIGIHGDDNGLVFPPAVAPVQVVVVPIPSKTGDTVSYAKEVYKTLAANGYRVKLDDRENYTPGFKYNDWEMKGVPVRVEVGDRELNANNVVLVSRTERKKTVVSVNDMISKLEELNDNIKKFLTDKARNYFETHIRKIKHFDDLDKSDGFVITGWCESRECAEKIEEKFELGLLGITPDNIRDSDCIVCGKPGKEATFSRSY